MSIVRLCQKGSTENSNQPLQVTTLIHIQQINRFNILPATRNHLCFGLFAPTAGEVAKHSYNWNEPHSREVVPFINLNRITLSSKVVWEAADMNAEPIEFKASDAVQGNHSVRYMGTFRKPKLCASSVYCTLSWESPSSVDNCSCYS
jgi:hypothetical protein